MIIFNNLDFANTHAIKIQLFVIFIMLLVYKGLTKLTARLTCSTIFILPLKILFDISFLATTWTNLIHVNYPTKIPNIKFDYH